MASRLLAQEPWGSDPDRAPHFAGGARRPVLSSRVPLYSKEHMIRHAQLLARELLPLPKRAALGAPLRIGVRGDQDVGKTTYCKALVDTFQDAVGDPYYTRDEWLFYPGRSEVLGAFLIGDLNAETEFREGCYYSGTHATEDDAFVIANKQAAIERVTSEKGIFIWEHPQFEDFSSAIKAQGYDLLVFLQQEFGRSTRYATAMMSKASPLAPQMKGFQQKIADFSCQ